MLYDSKQKFQKVLNNPCYEVFHRIQDMKRNSYKKITSEVNIN